MKKIAVLNVIALTIITLGIYPIFWLARNRNYIEKELKQDGHTLPRWQWLIAMITVVGAGFVIALVFLVIAALNGIAAEAGIISANVTLLAVGIIAYVIWAWWMWHFSKAIETITQGRLYRGWSLLLAIMAGGLVIAFFQFYINRLGENEAGKTYQTSPGVIVLAAVFTLLSIVSIVSTIANFESTNAELRSDILKSQTHSKKITELNNTYLQCIDQLNAKYSAQASVEQEAAFEADSAKCDDALKQYDRALEEYLKS